MLRPVRASQIRAWFVAAGGDDAVAIARERRDVDFLVVARQRDERFAGCDVPNARVRSELAVTTRLASVENAACSTSWLCP